MDNKDVAKNFLTLAASGKVREAYDKYVSPNFIHHNQYFKGDRESLMKGMEEAHAHSPNKSIDIKKCYVDGSHVITHSLVKLADEGRPSIVVIHISRIEDGKITELWDLGQEIMKNSPNENGPL